MTVMIPAWVGSELTPVEKLDAHKRGLKHKAITQDLPSLSVICLWHCVW